MQPFYVEAGNRPPCMLLPFFTRARSGIHCFLREEVSGDLFILAKGEKDFSF
jgi:hypothetical protein